MKKLLKNKLIYFILGVFFLWYIFPIIPIDKLLKSIPKDFAYHNLTCSLILLFCVVISTFLNLFFQFGLVYTLQKNINKLKHYISVFIISVVLLLMCVIWIEHYISVHNPKVFVPNSSYFLHLLAIGKNIGSKFVMSLPQRGIINFLIITLCFSFGSLLSYIVKEKNLLVPVMLCCAFIDIWTCTVGFVNKTIAKAPEIVSGVSTGVSMMGGSKILGVNLATIGPGDFIFASLVFAVVNRFNMKPKRTFWFMFIFLTLGMLLIVLGILPFLPALVCVALGTLISNYKEFNMSKQEKISVAIVFVLLLIIMFIFKFLKH